MADGMAGRVAPGLTARAAMAQPATLDEEAREVEVTFSTGARALNYVPGEGLAWEELDMNPNSIRMGRLVSGDAPVLDGHRGYAAEKVLGRVISARLENGMGVARLRFSAADDVRSTWQKIKDGTLRTVSVGYRIHGYEKTKAEDGRALIRATDWEPYEISVVPIPADAGATVRADTMAESAAADLVTQAAPAADQECERMADQANAAPGAPAAVDIEAVRAEAQRAERERMAGVDGVLSAARGIIPAETETALRGRALAEGLTVEQARAIVFDEMVRAQRSSVVSPVQTVRMGESGDDPASLRAAMAEAIAVRIRPTLKVSERAAEWGGVGLREMARELLTARGARNIPRNPALLAERAFHTTSDFPLLLSDALNKVLMPDYQQAAPSYRTFMARRVFSDFRAHKFLRVGDFPALAALQEGGEITVGTMSEGRETVTLATYAKGVRVTRQMLINDELGAFGDFAGMIGRRVLDFENATAFSIVNAGSGAGPNLADGNAVFTTARGNRASAGGAIDLTTLSTARAALRARTSPDGLKLNLAPRYLLTGPSYETIAWQFTSAQYVPATANAANPFRGVYEPLVDANISGNAWYLFADPAAAPVYIYGFLNGAEGPQVRTTNPPSSDGAVQIDVWLDFACGAIDWRGGQFNAGG